MITQTSGILAAYALAAYALAAYALAAGAPARGADPAAKTATASATIADTVSLSQAARDRAAAPADRGTLGLDTDQGRKDIDIGDYFSQGGGPTLDTLPPLLLPTQGNVDALTAHLSSVMPRFLADHGIPAAPASVTYDQAGQMQLPDDYPYADTLRQALADDPAMARELSAVNALASHVAAMKDSLAFSQEYSASDSPADTAAALAKYAGLFADNRHYPDIALEFTRDGRLSVSADGQPMA